MDLHKRNDTDAGNDGTGGEAGEGKKWTDKAINLLHSSIKTFSEQMTELAEKKIFNPTSKIENTDSETKKTIENSDISYISCSNNSVSGSEEEGTIELIDLTSPLSSPGIMTNNSLSGSSMVDENSIFSASMVAGEPDTSGVGQGPSSTENSPVVKKARRSGSGFKTPSPTINYCLRLRKS